MLYAFIICGWPVAPASDTPSAASASRPLYDLTLLRYAEQLGLMDVCSAKELLAISGNCSPSGASRTPIAPTLCASSPSESERLHCLEIATEPQAPHGATRLARVHYRPLL